MWNQAILRLSERLKTKVKLRLNWSPNTTHQSRLARAQMLRDIRAFLLQRDILEVETSALSQAANTDPFIASFKCINSKDSSRYLHTSPEYPMKRLLAAGSGDIYQICKVWREGESGDNHNPEFSLLEYYRVGFSYHQLIAEVSKLLNNLIPGLRKHPKLLTYEQLFLEKFKLNPHIANQDQLINCVIKNINGLATDGLNRQALLDALLTHCIEPEFDNDCLTFIYDYPVSQSALAQIREQATYPVAERFEVYLGQLELGNGYQEEICPRRNKQIFKAENNARLKMNLTKVTEDILFLQASKAGIPPAAGIAIGLDRVLMCITGEKFIQKVINFPWDKA